LPHEVEVHIERVLAAFLKFSGKEAFKDYLVYCVQEMAVNAKKANTKRVYFAEKGLCLDEPSDYEAGMAAFKKDTLADIARYLQLQKDKGLYIKLLLTSKKDSIQIEVRNNAVITRPELVRIHERLANAQQFNSMEDAFSYALDDSEGAGLGIIVMVLMLKKMNLDKDAFEITSTETETISKIVIPLDKVQVEMLSSLTKTIVDNVNGLPGFPENIKKLQNILDDPTVEMKRIATIISRDPTMTADLIKIANSAAYAQRKRVNSINEAVNLLGIKGIKGLLFPYGSQKILGEDSDKKKALWDHAYRTAFYAYNLVQNFTRHIEILDDVYVAGILHDMGKIVFSQAYPRLFNKIESFCTQKDIPQTVFENISGGMNHAEIGALIAEKWNFPENLVAAIRYHHNPTETPVHRDLVYAVYLANFLTHLEDNSATYEQVDVTVLNHFGLSNKTQVKSVVDKFREGLKKT
jgi:HD-like signal output (HDOD) protein